MEFFASLWLFAVAGGAILLGGVIAYGLWNSSRATRAQVEAGEEGARRLYGKETAVDEAVTADAVRREPHVEEPAGAPPNPIRPAGSEAIRNPQRQGDEVDRTSEQSFPASDPPGRY